MKIGACLFGGVWIAIWTLATLSFDVMLVRGVARQLCAKDWPTTVGRVIGADIKIDHDSESGSSYTPQIRYCYTVHGIEHQCDRIRFGFTMSGKRNAQRVVETYHSASSVVVHFNPKMPEQAVLETKVLTGGDLFGVIFMTPFNMILLASWFVAWKSIRGLTNKDDDEGAVVGSAARLIRDDGLLRVRLTKFSPLSAAAVASAGTAFALVFVIAFLFGTESRIASLVGCGLVVTAAVIAYRSMRSRINDGWYDLLINDARRVLTLPPKLKRADAGDIPFEEVTALEVAKVVGNGDDSDKYRPTLRWMNGGPRSAALADLTDPKAAEQLAQWLRTKIGVEAGEPDLTYHNRAVA